METHQLMGIGEFQHVRKPNGMDTSSPRATERADFTLVEFVIAAAVFGVLFTCCWASIVRMGDVRTRVVHENRALSVLDNTLERLASLPEIDAKGAAALLKQELQRGQLAGVPGVVCSCTACKGGLDLCIAKDGRSLATIAVGGNE